VTLYLSKMSSCDKGERAGEHSYAHSVEDASAADGLTKNDVWWMKFDYFAHGFATLTPWNVVLLASGIIGQKIMINAQLSQLICNLTMAGAAASALFLTFTTGYTTNRWFTRAYLMIVLVTFLLFTCPTNIWPSKQDAQTGGPFGLFGFICLAMGLGLGGLQTQSYAYSGIFGSIAESGAFIVTFAQAGGGVVVWVLYMIAERGIWKDSQFMPFQIKANGIALEAYWSSLRAVLWWICAAGMAIMLFFWAVYELTLWKVKPFSDVVKKVKSTSGDVEAAAGSSKVAPAAGEDGSLLEVKEKITIWDKLTKDVVSRGWFYALRPGLNLFCTLLVFPAFGPLKWDPKYITVHFGIFTIGDFVFRFAVFKIKFLQFSDRMCNFLLAGRFLILAPLMVIPAVSWGAVLQHPAFAFIMMIVWVISHATLFPALCVHCMTKPRNALEADAFACMMTCSIVTIGWLGSALSQVLIAALRDPVQ